MCVCGSRQGEGIILRSCGIQLMKKSHKWEKEKMIELEVKDWKKEENKVE